MHGACVHAARAAAGMSAAADDGSGSDDEKVSIPGYDGKNFEAPTAEEVAAARELHRRRLPRRCAV